MDASEAVLEDDRFFMAMALEQAAIAAEHDEVPVGAVVVNTLAAPGCLSDKVLSVGHNETLMSCDPSAHAEVVAIRQASRQIANHRLVNTTLYVTVEPCIMCVGAILQARISRVVFGALEPRAGSIISYPYNEAHHCYNHRFMVSNGIMADACGHLIKSFFKKKRKK